jgi:hypothetical protein
MNQKKPFLEMTRRRNIQGAIWDNQDSNGETHYSVGVTRSYKDKDEAWQDDTLYVPLDDIPRLIGVLREAETAIYQQLQVDYQEKKLQAAK